MKFNEISCSVSRVVLRGRTHRQTEMTQLIVAIRNFAKAHQNLIICGVCQQDAVILRRKVPTLNHTDQPKILVHNVEHLGS